MYQLIIMLCGSIPAIATVITWISRQRKKVLVEKHPDSEKVWEKSQVEWPFRRITLNVVCKRISHSCVLCAEVLDGGPEELKDQIIARGSDNLFWHGTFGAHPEEDDFEGIESGEELIRHYRVNHFPAAKREDIKVRRERRLNILWKVRGLEEIYLANTTGDKISFQGNGWIEIGISAGNCYKTVRLHFEHDGGTDPRSLYLKEVQDI